MHTFNILINFSRIILFYNFFIDKILLKSLFNTWFHHDNLPLIVWQHHEKKMRKNWETTFGGITYTVPGNINQVILEIH